MSTTNLPMADAIRIVVSEDRLSASLSVDAAIAPDGVTPAMVAAHLRAMGLRLDKERLSEFASSTLPIKLSKPQVIIQGRPPVSDSPGSIELLVTPPAAEGQTADSHYQRTAILSAVAGAAIARYTPPRYGLDGVDVFGRPLPHQSQAGQQAMLGPNTRLAENGQTVLATAGGVIRLQDNRLWIETKLEIPGNVDFSTGNIDFAGDIHVHGNIVDLFKVTSGGNIEVDGIIEAANVRAGQDLIATGGIVGKDKGGCIADHDISGKYMTNAHLEAGNDVIAEVEISNCRVICSGQVRVERGTVQAGHVTAAGGIICQTIGTASNVPTVVEVGIDEHLRQYCAEKLKQIDRQRRQVLQVRQTIEPLLRNQKKLNPQQKERATELLYDASELETKTNQTLQDLKRSYDTMKTKAHADIRVSEMVHGGVTLRFQGMEAVVQSNLRGPLRIARRQTCGNWQIVAISNGSVLPLPSHVCADKVMDELNRALAAT